MDNSHQAQMSLIGLTKGIITHRAFAGFAFADTKQYNFNTTSPTSLN